jgi:hypothetical protein
MMKTHPLLPALLMVAGLSMAAPACAAQSYRYQGPRGGYDRDIERRAYDIGYRDGVRAGERDGRSGRQFSFNRHDEWRDGDDGYRRDYGSRDFYRRSFRTGFESGYAEAYNRNSRYPRTGYPPAVSYPGPGVVVVPRATYSPAAQNGYRDGVEVGRNDARDRNRFDPARSRRYRDGDHDYDRRFGSRDAYRQEYRTAFQRGYEDGYRGVRR